MVAGQHGVSGPNAHRNAAKEVSVELAHVPILIRKMVVLHARAIRSRKRHAQQFAQVNRRSQYSKYLYKICDNCHIYATVGPLLY